MFTLSPFTNWNLIQRKTERLIRLVPVPIPHRFPHAPDLGKILPAFLFTQAMITIQINFIDGRVIYDYFRVLPHLIFQHNLAVVLPLPFSLSFYAENDKTHSILHKNHEFCRSVKSSPQTDDPPLSMPPWIQRRRQPAA